MANLSWTAWRGVIGNMFRPVKRVQRDGRRWEFASERLEARALLSATSIAPVAAEVSLGRKAFSFPEVAGNWTVNLGELGTASLVLTQDGTRVDSSLEAPIVGTVNTSDKFTKKQHHELAGKIKLTDETLGKITVVVSIEFPEEDHPTTFTGEARISGKQLEEPIELPLTGTRIPLLTAAATARGSKLEPSEVPDISGTWTLTATQGENELVRFINITQFGPDNIKVKANAVSFETGPVGARVSFEKSIRIKGKFDADNLLVVAGKATVIPVPGTTLKGRFQVVFNEALTTFDGVLQSTKFGEITLSGDKGGPA